jgi:hypothetical protein
MAKDHGSSVKDDKQYEASSPPPSGREGRRTAAPAAAHGPQPCEPARPETRRTTGSVPLLATLIYPGGAAAWAMMRPAFSGPKNWGAGSVPAITLTKPSIAS